MERFKRDDFDFFFSEGQFASRALPSAGVLPFLQSFICTINNECDSLDKYEEIPNYNKSRYFFHQTIKNTN